MKAHLDIYYRTAYSTGKMRTTLAEKSVYNHPRSLAVIITILTMYNISADILV